MFAVFPQPVLIMLIRVLKGNPYLVNWFNPSISVVHGLVSVTDKCNMISEALPADAEGTAAWSRGKSRTSRPRYQVSLSPWRLLSHLLPGGICMTWETVTFCKYGKCCHLAWMLRRDMEVQSAPEELHGRDGERWWRRRRGGRFQQLKAVKMKKKHLDKETTLTCRD